LNGAQWRFALTDEHGRLTHCGITRARPTGVATRSGACRAIVELQVPVDTLRALATKPTALGQWTGVVADLTRQLDHVTTSDISGGTPGGDWYRADAARRAPGAALRRYLEIRDRYCTMIGCRAPARSADKDHTLDHAKGGPTIGANLGDACRHDHRLKHEGGWILHQPHPGAFHWTTVSV
ncbi:MAG: HNH endonuclease signature motif containing protein, partial [Pseudonocardiaceae bacterium]